MTSAKTRSQQIHFWSFASLSFGGSYRRPFPVLARKGCRTNLELLDDVWAGIYRLCASHVSATSSQAPPAFDFRPVHQTVIRSRGYEPSIRPFKHEPINFNVLWRMVCATAADQKVLEVVLLVQICWMGGGIRCGFSSLPLYRLVVGPYIPRQCR